MTTTRKGNSTKGGGSNGNDKNTIPSNGSENSTIRRMVTRNSNKNNSNGAGDDDTSDKENNNRSIVPSAKGKTKNRRQILSPSSVSNTAISPKKKKTKTSSLPVVIPTTSPVSYRTRGKLALLNRPPPLPIVPVTKAYFHYHYNMDLSNLRGSNSLLRLIIQQGDEVGLRMLKLYWNEAFRKGFDKLLNRRDVVGCGAVHYAALAPKGVDVTSCLKFILDCKGDVNMQEKGGVTPVSLVTDSGNNKMLKIMLDYKADVNLSDRSGCVPLCVARDAAAVTMLVKAGASVNSISPSGVTPLYTACHRSRIGVIHRLLDFKADINYQMNGITALMAATYKGKIDVVRHRIRFRCKVCHADLGFKFQAGGNEINMLKIIDGEYCGACHNGEIAWSVENCNLCHSGKPGTPTQVHLSTVQRLISGTPK